jgi:hypothetical protein
MRHLGLSILLQRMSPVVGHWCPSSGASMRTHRSVAFLVVDPTFSMFAAIPFHHPTPGLACTQRAIAPMPVPNFTARAIWLGMPVVPASLICLLRSRRASTFAWGKRPPWRFAQPSLNLETDWCNTRRSNTARPTSHRVTKHTLRHTRAAIFKLAKRLILVAAETAR